MGSATASLSAFRQRRQRHRQKPESFAEAYADSARTVPDDRFLTVSANAGARARLQATSFETLPKRLTRTMRPQHEPIPSSPSRGGSPFIRCPTVAVVALVGEAGDAARQSTCTPWASSAAPDGAGTRAASRSADPADAHARVDHPLRAGADRSPHADAERRPDDAHPVETLGIGRTFLPALACRAFRPPAAASDRPARIPGQEEFV